jgi:hypothetical protein
MFIFTTARQEEETHMADPLPYPGAPRWVKASGIAVGVVALLVVILIHVGGDHNIQSAGGLGGHGHAAPESGH